MLDRLYKALDNELPELLAKPEVWDSLIVNRRKPFTYRVFTQLHDGIRICLHKFDSCFVDEAFDHPHPWEGAFIVLKGRYEMNVAYSCGGREDNRPDNVAKFIMGKFSSYEITNPLTWHSVVPLETTWTVMINGKAWDEDFAHSAVRRTKGKDLDKMPQDDLADHLVKFRSLLEDFQWSGK